MGSLPGPEVRTIPCQGYALARGYASLLNRGADVVVPAGLAWQMARGSPPIPAACAAAIDAEYEGEPNVLAALPALPLTPSDPAIARWEGDAAGLGLYRDKGPNYTSPYCDNNCTIDHHASELGMCVRGGGFSGAVARGQQGRHDGRPTTRPSSAPSGTIPPPPHGAPPSTDIHPPSAPRAPSAPQR